MARTNNLTNFLNDVATAIKTKLGDSTSIPAAQFDSKIMDITTGGTYQTKSITITTNGDYTQLPDTGYDAMDQVVISVNVPQTGGAVKLFATEQAMQADPNPSEGDLAVVYREEIQPVQEDSEFDSCIFPNTVVLDEAFSDSIYGSFRSTGSSYFDGMVEMSSSRFRFNGWGDSGNINVQYTSSDGITYTRTDSGEELQEFGTAIKYEPYEPWNDVIGKFMKIGGNVFEGLYEYQKAVDTTKINFANISSLQFGGDSRGDYDAIATEFTTLTITQELIDLIRNNINFSTNWNWGQVTVWFQNAHTLRLVGWVINQMNCPMRAYFDSNKNFLGVNNTGHSTSSSVYYADVDLTNMTITTGTLTANSNGVFECGLTLPNLCIISTGEFKATDTCDSSTFFLGSSTISAGIDYSSQYNIFIYDLAQTQLTLKNANELLPNIIAYGKNGVVTGDGSIYNNLDNGYILQNIYNLPQINSTLYGYNIKSTAVPNNINIPKAKGCYIKPSAYTNNALFDISNIIKTGSTNYLSNSGNYYVNNKIVYDSHTHESVRDLGQIYMLDYYNGCVLYTKEQIQPTVSSVIYKYDIDNNTEVAIGSTAAISSSYNWTYKYTHFLVLGNILICDANGENNSPNLIAASLKVCNLDTGVECVIYNHQNTISSGSNLGYTVTPILVNDNKLVIFERFKNSSGSYIYYMYDYTISTNTLLVKANATTTQLIKSSTNYMYKQGYCIVDNYAIVVQDSYAYALNISQPTAMIYISSDSALKTCIFDYKNGSVPYTYDSVTTRWRCVTNITYDGATNLSFTFGDYLPFGNNCPLYTLAGTSIGLISSADAVTYTFDSVNSKYIATSKKGNIIGINMNVEPYILTTTNDASRYIIDGNADSSSSYKLLSVFDII